MADKILHKRSATPSAVPSAASLALGELALNTADGRAFMKKNDGAVVEIGSNASGYFRTEPITAAATGQTSFTIPGGYTPGAIFVSLNGANLPPADFTATNGTTVVLASGSGIVAGSVLLVHVLSAFEVADALPLGGTAANSSKLGGQAPSHYATQAALDAKVDGADVDFTIIYPNGGSAASPANVAANSRYVMDNPFPGYRVFCIAEVRLGGEWVESGWFTWRIEDFYSQGVKASQFNDGSIVVQTGNNAPSTTTASWSGQAKAATMAEVYSMPCRVRVYKLKGLI